MTYPSTSNANGIWTLRDVFLARKEDIWPSVSVLAPNLNLDPFFDYVSLLLSMDGDDASTTFTDSSNNGLTVTAYGNTAISASESKFGQSAAFDGTGDFIQTGASTALQLSSGDFTIEAWVYFTALDTNTTVARLAGGDSVDGILFCHYVSSGAGKLFITSNGFSWDVRDNGSDFTGLTTNQWFHLALSRSGTTFRTFVNGTLISTFTSSASIYQSSNIARIGAANSNGAFAMGGYIDDFRITKGFCRYTADFTPPTLPFATAAPVQLDPYFDNYVSLLMHMDGVNGSVAFTDESANNLTVTANGNTQISTSESKFGGASAYFNGNGYLDITDNAVLDFADGSDFTIECWFYLSNTAVGGLFGRGGGAGNWSTSNGWYYMVIIGDGTVTLYYNRGGEQAITFTTTAPSVSTWNHFAMVRSHGKITAYLNGTSFGSSTIAMVAPTTRSLMHIGVIPGIGFLFYGYIDEFRITRGTARYTTNFTPPTKAFSDTLLTNDLYFDNVSLLLPMDGTNGSTTFTDESNNGLTVTANGNAQISTSESKFGGASAAFDGTGDYLAITDNAALDFTDGNDFTIEFWFYRSGTSGFGLFGRGGGAGNWSTSDGHYYLAYILSGTLYVQYNYGGGVSTPISLSTTAPSVSTWNHFAMVRSGGTITAYLNGTSFGSSTSTLVAPTTRNITRIGDLPNGSAVWNGYIDDFRITKGVARYTASFNPPTRALLNE